MSALLREAGIGLNEVEFVNIGGSAAIFRAVAGGIIDAGPGEPELMYEADDYGVQVIGPVWELLPQMIGQASYASDRTIADKRDIIVRTLAAYRRLYQFINGPDSLDAFVAARNTAMRDEDDESATNQWRILQENRNMADDLVLPRDRIEWLQELNIALGVQQRILPYEEVTDVSIAEEALALETSA
jgi:ABC-type nitrate/sulfonate/bicarbonate transport system substrate-binding protein